MKINHPLILIASAMLCLMAAGCSSDSDSDTETTSTTDTTTGLDISMFVDGALVSSEIVDCTLSDGSSSTCYEIKTVGAPAGIVPGPYCPENINVDADDAGLWIDNDTVYAANGTFILDLPNIYNDDTWKLYDDMTGDVYITDTQVSCEAAANPDVGEEYKNYCVQCEMEYLDDGVMPKTWTIPVTPTAAGSTTDIGNDIGVALSGAEISGPAPIALITAAYTIAAFDNCGAHVNVHQGYHMHAAVSCEEAGDVGAQDDGHANLIGYALDGYGLYGELDSDGLESTGLDSCRGVTHDDDTRGYHYHAASASENLFIGCYSGLTAEGSTTDPTDGPPGGPPRGDAGGSPQG